MIKPLTLAEVSNRFGGELVNGSAEFDSVTTDSRLALEGELFVALKGDSFDAHDYLDQVVTQKVCGLVINENHKDKVSEYTLPIWLVDDTVKALGFIARAQRANFKGSVLAITGSNGKTSVKGMLASIVTAAVGEEKVFATKGNLNNHLGVPFSLLSIDKACEYAVIEMGASAVGEIDYLSSLAEPHVALVNNVSPVHVEGFGSVDNIALAKSEIYDHLMAGGAAIVNADDIYAPQWFAKNKGRTVLSFSAKDITADIFIHEESMDAHHCWRFVLRYQDESVEIQLKVLGEHAVMNAAAAASMALAANISLDAIKKGLENFTGVTGRLQIGRDFLGNTLIDDTYNASPKSMRAAIDVLASFSQQKILIMGDMGELGESAQQEHKAIGDYAKVKGVDYLFASGELSKQAAKSFGRQGEYNSDFSVLMNQVKEIINQPSCILVKGSRSTRMERAVNFLKQFGESNASLVS